MPPDTSAQEKRASWFIGIGVLVFLASALITLVSYSNASQRAEENRGEEQQYVILWAPALVGIVLTGVGMSQRKEAGEARDRYEQARLERQAMGTRAREGKLEDGWHVDPTGRHQLRHWDGKRWTEEVLDGGNPSRDPVAPGAAHPGQRVA